MHQVRCGNVTRCGAVCSEGDPGREEVWKNLVASMAPCNVDVAAGDAAAITEILEHMMLARTVTQKWQVSSVLSLAFEQVSRRALGVFVWS